MECKDQTVELVVWVVYFIGYQKLSFRSRSHHGRSGNYIISWKKGLTKYHAQWAAICGFKALPTNFLRLLAAANSA